MRKLQVVLNEKHYEYLKKLSKQEKKSVSQVLREIINSYAEKSEICSLSSLAGMAEDTACCGSDHDKWLHSKK